MFSGGQQQQQQQGRGLYRRGMVVQQPRPVVRRPVQRANHSPAW